MSLTPEPFPWKIWEHKGSSNFPPVRFEWGVPNPIRKVLQVLHYSWSTSVAKDPLPEQSRSQWFWTPQDPFGCKRRAARQLVGVSRS